MNGGRKDKTCLGHSPKGLTAHIRGWDSGVKVVATHYKSQPGAPDGFALYATTGSNGDDCDDVYLGEVILKGGKLTFNKAKVK